VTKRKVHKEVSHETASQKKQAPPPEGNPAARFYKQHQKAILTSLTVLLLLIPIVLSIWFRSYTATLPAANNWARMTVENNVKNSIANQVQQQFPNLPTSNRQTLVDQQYQQFLAQNKDQFNSQVQQTAAYFRSRMQDANGHTYMPDLDTYYHLRRIDNIVAHGYAGDVMVDGQEMDDHMLAPLGVVTQTDTYTWFVAHLYKIYKVFNDVPTMYFFFWIPVLFAALAVIPAFLIGRKQGLLVSFFTAMLIAVHASIIGRTAAGYADTDILVVFFPVLVAWLFVEAFEAERWKPRLIYLVSIGLAFGLFARMWGYWWFFFDVFLLVIVAYLLYQVLRYFVNGGAVKGLVKSTEIRWSALLLACFIVVVGLFVTIFNNFSNFSSSFSLVFSTAANFKDAVSASTIWPNVLTTVAELNEPSIAAIISSVGGKLLFLLALMGMLFSLVPEKRLHWKDWTLLGIGFIVFLYLISAKGTALPIMSFLLVMAIPVLIGGLIHLKDERDIDMKYAIFLAAWLAASLFTMTKGVRFVLLLIPPFAFGAGITVGRIYTITKAYLTENASLSKLWVAPALFLMLSLLLWPIAVHGRATGLQGTPQMSDGWWDSLTYIKNNSTPDAIINSWWDFGHWFKYVADRRVTFDGASQTVPDAHWIGKALITSDEKETLAILRMIDCGNYQGTQDIKDALPGHDEYAAIALTKRLILLPHDDAHQLLLDNGLSEEQAQTVLNHTHCDPPEDYFITSGDMVGKAGVWGHFGSWNFTRADAYQKFRTRPETEAVPTMAAKYGLSEDEASQLYYQMQTLPNQGAVNQWISPWPGYATGLKGCAEPVNGSMLCGINLRAGQQQSVTTVIDGLVYNLTSPERSFLVVGFYDAKGQRVGQNTAVSPASLVVLSNGTTETYAMNATFGQSVLLDLDNRRIILADPLLVDSIFTRLFYLDGADTRAFRKVSDQTTFTGTRIIVWKVDWTKLKGFGLA